MTSLFEEFASLWSEEELAPIKDLLSNVQFAYYPDEVEKIDKLRNASSVVIVLTSSGMKDLMYLASRGFQHCIHKARKDFKQEVLAAALMVARPGIFSENTAEFFFSSFDNPKKAKLAPHLALPLRGSADKNHVMEQLADFISQNEKLSSVGDLCQQAVDEMISNALFSAPVNFLGKALYQNTERTQQITLDEKKQAKVFITVDDMHLTVGCQDAYGSLTKDRLTQQLLRVFDGKKTHALEDTAGAGLGFKTMIDNAASFYVYSEKGKKLIVACAYLLDGYKANLAAPKNLHLSFS